MTTTEFVRMTNIPRHRIYYMEQCGYIAPRKSLRGEYLIRDYSNEDARTAQAIWRYVQQGFKWRIAHEKALKDLNGNKMHSFSLSSSEV